MVHKIVKRLTGDQDHETKLHTNVTSCLLDKKALTLQAAIITMLCLKQL